MADQKLIPEYLEKYFDEITPQEFYRSIFPPGEMETHQDKGKTGKYNAIAVELLPKEEANKCNARRYLLTDELDYLEELLKKNNFIIISPITYCGMSREAKNARYIYALAIDLDGVETEQNLVDLFYQIENDILPKPTYIVSSGSGCHLYYVFEKPIPCYDNITRQLAALKNDLTKKIWNKYVTTLYEKPQLQSIYQGFRMCGGVTKSGSRTRAFVVGSKTTVEYLNNYVLDIANQVKDIKYKNDLSLAEAAKLYPDWYEKRIVQQQPKGKWICKRDLYNWWLRRIKNEIVSGHRFYGIMCLAIYAKKSGVPFEELEKDAFDLLDRMEQLTTDEKNHFTREDILAALELYNDNYYTFPIDTISQLTALRIEKNKRNGRSQEDHLEIARFTLKVMNKKELERSGKCLQGRKSNKPLIQEWKIKNPGGSIEQCQEDLKVSRATVYRYWNID